MSTSFDGVEITTATGTEADKPTNALTNQGKNEQSSPLLSIIWLHGLGADGHDFAAVVPELEKLGVHRCRFIFPHAPHQAVTINGGMKMRSWYDITSLDFKSREQDTDGIRASAVRLENLIQREIDRGVPAEQIMIAGFSQGGAVALHTLIRLEFKIAGVIALSTYLPLSESVAVDQSQANQHTPIFMAHGQQDDVIDLRYAEESRDTLVTHGYTVQWKSYAIPHSLSIDEIVDLAQWITTNRPI